MNYKNQASTILVILVIFFLSTTALANGERDICPQLEKQVDSVRMKYSISANVDGPIYFANIGCGILLRKDLCAMEMVAFDTSAKVFDFSTGEEIESVKAFYVLGGKKEPIPEIIAFKEKKGAEEYAAEHGGRVMDFDTLAQNI